MIALTLNEQQKNYERNLIMTTENKLQLIRMSEVVLQPVDWLWYPYLPFGKLAMIQGDPGEGKTTLALRLAAACSRGEALPGMVRHEPFNVLYQTAEDGLGDTIKPRLIDAGADEKRIFCIDERVHSLSLLDERIESAIRETGARLMILDPVQAYVGEKVDMNRANEVRTVLKKGCRHRRADRMRHRLGRPFEQGDGLEQLLPRTRLHRLPRGGAKRPSDRAAEEGTPCAHPHP